MDPGRLIRIVSILIASSMFLLVFTIGLPMLHVSAHGVIGSHVQATPSSSTPLDPTVTALQKAQLAQQLEKLQHDNDWLWNSSPALLSTLAVITAALIGIFRWLQERRDELLPGRLDPRVRELPLAARRHRFPQPRALRHERHCRIQQRHEADRGEGRGVRRHQGRHDPQREQIRLRLGQRAGLLRPPGDRIHTRG